MLIRRIVCSTLAVIAVTLGAASVPAATTSADGGVPDSPQHDYIWD